MTAKKDKKARRLAKKRKLQRRTQPSGQQALLKRVRSSERLKDSKVIVNDENIEKMSDVILRFAEPILHDVHDVADQNAIRFAIGVWNASLLPEPEQSEALSTIIEMIPAHDPAARRELSAAISMLLARKRRYFASNTRVILDYQITQSGGRLHLDVVSTLAKDEIPDT